MTKLTKQRLKHADDIEELLQKYMRRHLSIPFGFESKKKEQEFWAEFQQRGHDHFESAFCKCMRRF